MPDLSHVFPPFEAAALRTNEALHRCVELGNTIGPDHPELQALAFKIAQVKVALTEGLNELGDAHG